MLKTNQKNVHAFEIEKQEPEAVIGFLEKNHMNGLMSNG